MTRRLIALTVALAAVAVAGSAAAQLPPRVAYPPVDAHRYQVDRHRYEMDRLRAQADQRQAFADRVQLEGRLTVQRLEASRLPEPATVTPTPLRSPEQERAARLAATERRAATVSAVSEIDAWLDRTRD
ncbi:MAG: hypothetical protein ACK4VY_07035 [Brevundimonas sp.]